MYDFSRLEICRSYVVSDASNTLNIEYFQARDHLRHDGVPHWRTLASQLAFRKFERSGDEQPRKPVTLRSNDHCIQARFPMISKERSNGKCIGRTTQANHHDITNMILCLAKSLQHTFETYCMVQICASKLIVSTT